MTTNASKFGLRKAAQERTNRHAQRTPLPPRPEAVADAKEVVAEAATIIAGSERSAKKAQALQAVAEETGWTVTLSSHADSPERVDLVAQRENEALHQAWLNGVWQYESSTYTIADRTTRPRNAAGATKLLTRSAEVAQAELTKVSTNTFFRRKPSEDAPRKHRPLPFGIAAPDEDVIAALEGKKVKWINRLSQQAEEAFVTPRGKFTRLVQIGDERVFQFCEHRGQGFRAFRLSDIVRVR